MFVLSRLIEVTNYIDLPEYYVLSCCSMKQTQLKLRNVEVVMVLKLHNIRKYSVLWKQIAVIDLCFLLWIINVYILLIWFCSRCCDSCEAVKEAYRRKRWAFHDLDTITQCQSEHYSERLKNAFSEACQIYGYVEVNRVSLNLLT